MKTNTFKKATIATMAIAMGAAIAGSVSGTVAWYQYSTRSTVAYQGAAAHCTESVQVRIRANNDTAECAKWKQDLLASDIASYLSTAADDATTQGAGRTVAGNKLTPVTSGELAAGQVAANLYKNPIYQYPNMADWGVASATEDYIILPLEIRVLDVNGNTTAPSYLAKNIYVSDVTLQARASHDDYDKTKFYDMSSALRVGVSAGTDASSLTDYATFATSASAVNVYGKLDLNNNGKLDREAGYEWDTREEVMYGVNTKTAVATANTQLASTATATTIGVANDSDASSIKGKPIGATTAALTLKVNLKIYLEGWTELSDKKAKNSSNEDVDIKSIWDIAKANGAEFNVGIRFSAEAHNQH